MGKGLRRGRVDGVDIEGRRGLGLRSERLSGIMGHGLMYVTLSSHCAQIGDPTLEPDAPAQDAPDAAAEDPDEEVS